jgi:hypothetical protein
MVLGYHGGRLELTWHDLGRLTDNANYDDLGILVAGYSRFNAPRAIHEMEAARAMQICEEAGIELRATAIWKDRQQILRGLKDGDLKRWLEQKQ